MTYSQTFGTYRLDVETGGYCRFDVELTNTRHRHDYFEICLALEGAGRFLHGGEIYDLRPGDVFVANPGVVHEISSFETRDLELYFVSLNLKRLNLGTPTPEDRIIAHFDASHQILISRQQNLNRYLGLLDESSTGLSREAALQALKYLTLEFLQALSGAKVTETQGAGKDFVTQALAYIETHLDRRLSVEEVSRAVGLSPRALRRHFDNRIGRGIAEEVLQRKMRRAAHRLLMGFAIGEVAEMAGIDDTAQFSRSFARSIGMPPKRFQSTYVPGNLSRHTATESD
jgi:AraC family L-rhamnose operon transcriptional activator RhaR